MAERIGSSYPSGAEDRLPWLEPVEDEATDYVVPRGRLAGGVIAALVVIAFVVGGLFWLRQPHQATSSEEVALIQAPAGSYKTKPANPGGMKVAGEGEAAFQTSQGGEPNGTIDTSATPEAPVKAPAATKIATATMPKAAAATATPPKPTATATAVPTKPAAAATTKPAATAIAAATKPPVKPVAKPTVVAIKTVPTPPAKPSSTTVALPEAKPATSGVSIQLGAFSSQAAADAAWKSLSGRFASLGGLTKNVVAAPKGDGTVYRLRATGAGAPAACGKLKVAGESCVVIRD